MFTKLYPILIHIHSGIRWILIAGLIVSVIVSLGNVLKNNGISHFGKNISRITFLTAHLQLLAGLLLYMISPKVVFSADSMSSPILRFFLVEHISAMILVVLFITLGFVRSKKKGSTAAAARNIFWFYILALALTLALIPWPWMSYGGQWF